MKKGSKVFVFITAMLLTLGGMKAIAHHRGYDRSHYGCHGMHKDAHMNGCRNYHSSPDWMSNLKR